MSVKQKKNELNVDDLIGSLDGKKNSDSNDGNKKNTSKSGWDEREDDNTTSSFLSSQTGSSSKKTGKPKNKTNTTIGWNQDTDNSAPIITEEKPEKGKMMRKPAEKVAPTVTEEMFPSLGEEPIPQTQKKEESKIEVKPTTSTTTTTTGAPRFVNAKKTTTGETFVPVTVDERPVPQTQKPSTTSETVTTTTTNTSAEKIFQRNTGNTVVPTEEAPKTTQTEDDSKFRFGSEGPKKFSSSKAGNTKREENKSEQDILREQKEREIEAKLLKEKEEAAKKAELIKKKKEEGGFKSDEKPHRKHEETKTNETHDPSKETTQQSESRPENKFSNNKKKDQAPKKVQEEQQKKTEPVVEEPENNDEPKAIETKQIETKASSATWGEMLPRKKK